jgi:hypothetical protein
MLYPTKSHDLPNKKPWSTPCKKNKNPHDKKDEPAKTIKLEIQMGLAEEGGATI